MPIPGLIYSSWEAKFIVCEPYIKEIDKRSRIYRTEELTEGNEGSGEVKWTSSFGAKDNERRGVMG